MYQDNISLKHKDFLESKFEFDGNFSMKTGEEKAPQTRKTKENEYAKTLWRNAVYKNTDIMIGCKVNPLTKRNKHSLKAVGSVQKYACNGDNSGYFSPEDAVKALDNICSELRIDKNKATPNCLEIGLNIYFKDALEFLNLYLIKRFKDKPFDRNAKHCNNGYIAVLTHYDFKLYAKDKDILRLEIRWNNMQELRKQYKLNKVADITPNLIKKIALKTLSERSDNIMCLNGIDIITKVTKRDDGMKIRELLLLTQFSNTNYLEKLKERLSKCPKEKRNAIYQADRRALIRFENTVRKYQKIDFVKYLKGQIINQLEKRKCQLFISGNTHPNYAIVGDLEDTDFNTGIKLRKLTYSNTDDTHAKVINKNKRDNNRMRRIKESMGKDLINKIKVGNRALAAFN